jgi:hypothetical protein
MTDFHRTAGWFALTREMRPIIQRQVDAGTAVCVDCGGPVLPGERWQVGHRLDRYTYPQYALERWNVGPSHGGTKGRSCNQRAGGKIGARITHAKRARKKAMIQWR